MEGVGPEIETFWALKWQRAKRVPFGSKKVEIQMASGIVVEREGGGDAPLPLPPRIHVGHEQLISNDGRFNPAFAEREDKLQST